MFKKSLLTVVCASLLYGCGGGGTSSPSNSAPSFGQSQYQLTLDEDNSASITVSASDIDGDSLSYSLSNAAANGAVEIDASSGLVSYQPDANFFGEDNFEVAVTDGSRSVNTSVAVTVNPVNDLPVLNIDQVLVSGGEVKSGQITATDIDGDVLTYSLVQSTQNGELALDTATGALTYQPTELVNIDDSFVVKVDDGNGGELEKTLVVKANLATNADRAFYYYASEDSHLKQAEQIISNINDDINQGEVFANLAVGYAEAGLIKQVERIITEQMIVRDELRAWAMLNVSKKYNELGLLSQADAYRVQANSLYTQYVAAKGVSAFNTDDTMFYDELAHSYLAVGNYEKAQESYGILDLLFATALEGEATTGALRTYFGYRDLVTYSVEKWQASLKQEDYDLAMAMNARLYKYANMIGHRYVSNDNNGNEGKPYHSVRQVALSFVIELYMELNQFDLAKEALHDTLALHGIVGLDSNYPREQDPYFEVTKVEYEYGLVGVVTSYVVLYPEADVEQVLAGLPADSFWISLARMDAEDARLMALVRNMADKDAALNLVIAAKDESDLRNHFTNLVAFNSVAPGGAIYLRKQGEYEAAAKFLMTGLSVLSSDKYIEQNLDQEPFVTGATGCQLVLEELLQLYRITQQESFLTQAQTALDACANIVKTHFADGIDGTDVGIDDAVEASGGLFAFKGLLNLSAHEASLLTIIEQNLAKLDDTEHARSNYLLGSTGFMLANGGDFVKAQQYYDRAITSLNQWEATVVADEVGVETQNFFNSRRKPYDYSSYLNVIRRQAGLITDYQQVYDKAVGTWQQLIDSRLADLADSSNQHKLNFLPAYASQLIELGKYDAAQVIANNEVLGVVEKESILTSVAANLSTKDDFVHTAVATVDTDGDGQANFFLQIATEAQIAASGLVLDSDSDNDGAADEVDAFPLDASQQ